MRSLTSLPTLNVARSIQPTPIPTAGPTQAPTLTPTPTTRYFATDASFTDGGVNGNSTLETKHEGALSPEGAYINMGEEQGKEGTWVEWRAVDGGPGGGCQLAFRYANGNSTGRQCSISLFVDNTLIETRFLTFTSTGSWTNWAEIELSSPSSVPCAPGARNVYRVTATTKLGGPNLDYMDVTVPDESGLELSKDVVSFASPPYLS